MSEDASLPWCEECGAEWGFRNLTSPQPLCDCDAAGVAATAGWLNVNGDPADGLVPVGYQWRRDEA